MRRANFVTLFLSCESWKDSSSCTRGSSFPTPFFVAGAGEVICAVRGALGDQHPSEFAIVPGPVRTVTRTQVEGNYHHWQPHARPSSDDYIVRHSQPCREARVPQPQHIHMHEHATPAAALLLQSNVRVCACDCDSVTVTVTVMNDHAPGSGIPVISGFSDFRRNSGIPEILNFCVIF